MARRERNVPKGGSGGRPAKSAGVRRNPRKHAGTGAIRQEKTPTESGWGFNIGGGGGNRPRVRKSSTVRSTYLVRLFGFNPGDVNRQTAHRRSTLVLAADEVAPSYCDPLYMTLQPGCPDPGPEKNRCRA